jgi:hypothetical protein
MDDGRPFALLTRTRDERLADEIQKMIDTVKSSICLPAGTRDDKGNAKGEAKRSEIRGQRSEVSKGQGNTGLTTILSDI